MVDVMGRKFKPYDPERGEEWERGAPMSVSQPYRIFVRSKPGFYEQYNGYVEVYACDSVDATEKGLDKLQRTSFPDRNRDMWEVEAVICMGKEITL